MLLDNMTKYLNVLLRSDGAHSGPRHRHVIDVLRYVLLSRMAWSGVSHLLYDNLPDAWPSSSPLSRLAWLGYFTDKLSSFD